MNINQYKNTLDTISLKQYSIEELQKIMKNKRKKKQKIIVMMICIMLLSVIITPKLFVKNESYIISVYASNGSETNLSNELKKIDINTEAKYASTLDDMKESDLNINIFFGIEGENIKTVTFKCSDNEITRNNLSKEQVYFIENIAFLWHKLSKY